MSLSVKNSSASASKKRQTHTHLCTNSAEIQRLSTLRLWGVRESLLQLNDGDGITIALPSGDPDATLPMYTVKVVEVNVPKPPAKAAAQNPPAKAATQKPPAKAAAQKPPRPLTPNLQIHNERLSVQPSARTGLSI